MTDIPEDVHGFPPGVWKAASAVTKKQPTSFGWRAATEDVARAIIADRERTILIIEKLVDQALPLGTEVVAAAIRAGEA